MLKFFVSHGFEFYVAHQKMHFFKQKIQTYNSWNIFNQTEPYFTRSTCLTRQWFFTVITLSDLTKASKNVNFTTFGPIVNINDELSRFFHDKLRFYAEINRAFISASSATVRSMLSSWSASSIHCAISVMYMRLWSTSRVLRLRPM